jgi:hypothetical protein
MSKKWEGDPDTRRRVTKTAEKLTRERRHEKHPGGKHAKARDIHDEAAEIERANNVMDKMGR